MKDKLQTLAGLAIILTKIGFNAVTGIFKKKKKS